MIISAHTLFSDMSASEAAAAFNVITLEHAEAIVQAAEEVNRPVILQLSQNAIAFHRGSRAIAKSMIAVAEESSATVVLHLDHITDIELARSARDLGFSSVMFDAAAQDFADNVVSTRRVAEWGHDVGVWVEAELGEIGGKEGAHTPGVRTRPDDAAHFVDLTGVDSLAVAVGSSHAMTTRSAHLDTDLIHAIAQSVDVPLVLHGSSGVPDSELTTAVSAGMRKINIGTALNVAYTHAVSDWLGTHDGTDPRKYISPARDAVARTCAHVLNLLSPV
ncbi:class II fructose-bisphosphate aldolase [Paramicrobacterium chengjingii]|uniref:Class II fructose-bisphosphate aldolase n=1 Tax=Paramicrobacterium chengjingii TaxID=2769067 RepID=A0ABX6YJE5_9MICO|nr:class II fructose-bisphosphate aldolase [Microbacterium chengjingii]QPZ38871.1 class II fructose-bisphosphate aldolase [Microbacterium chengjingii]